MSLVLVAVSNDPDSFKDLISGKSYMEKATKLTEINTRLILELSSHSSNCKIGFVDSLVFYLFTMFFSK
jgi:hypothetical protein